MGKFKVKGALQESAEDVEVVIEASSYKEAERAANKMGILVSDVLVVEETKAETREKNPNTEEEFERRKFVKIALICVPILVLVGVILTLIDTSPKGRHDWSEAEYDSWVESEDVRAGKTVPSASTSSGQPPQRASKSPKPNQPKEWWEGGSLYRASVSEWRNATAENKLATCGDWCAAVDSSVSIELIRMRAAMVVICVDKAVSGGDADNFQAIEMAMLCIQTFRSEGKWPW